MSIEKRRHVSGSQEDYLEVILELVRQGGVARVRDIAERMQVAKSSVTVALRALTKNELVIYEPYQLVRLSDQGRAAAESVRRRHSAVRAFLVGVLGVDEAVADANACRIEHAVDDGVLRRLSCFAEFMTQSDVAARQLPSAFARYCARRQEEKQCNMAGKEQCA